MKIPLFTFSIFSSILILSGCSSKSECGNTILLELPNDGQTHRIVLFERDCGATTEMSYQVSVVKIREKLGNEAGNVFISDFKPAAFWKKDTVIIRVPPHVNTFKRELKVGEILIFYESK